MIKYGVIVRSGLSFAWCTSGKGGHFTTTDINAAYQYRNTCWANDPEVSVEEYK